MSDHPVTPSSPPSPRRMHRLRLMSIPNRVEEQITMTMVAADVTKQQNKQQQGMNSEVSSTASSAGLLGLGSIIGSILKYVATFLIQYGFGPAGYGLYTLSLSLVYLVCAI